MRFLLVLIGWFLLFAVCWPLALGLIVLAPILWLLWLPFRLLGLTIEALFAFLRALFLLPARLLGHKDRAC
ncbi:MAG: hypothetical protein JNK85_20415 [Verrucomicrobiales bacterium]|nr:hypothetical protein [Verrucomicrobiales bacterium]